MPFAGTAQDRSLGDLLRDLSSGTGDLLRKEVELAKAEMSEKAARVGADLGAIAVGGGLALAGALALAYAAIMGLTALLDTFLPLGVAVWLAPLLVGGVLVTIALGRIKNAVADLKETSLVPRQTTHSLQENKEWLKAKIQ